MPRKRTGTVRRKGDHHEARVILRDGSKSPWISLSPGLTDEEAAAVTRQIAERAASDGWSRPEAPTHPSASATVSTWFDAWIDHRIASGHTSTDDDRGRWTKWIAPRLERKLMRAVTRGDLEDLVYELDRHVQAGDLSWKTARNVWGIATKMFDDAATSKNRALRVRDDNPAASVKPPDKGGEKSLAWLYPREVLALVDVPRIPLRWRRLFAIATYTYARQGELEALEWGDVDFDARTIHLHRAIERKSGEMRTVKSERPRRIPLEAELVPLLVCMITEAKGDRVIDMPPAGDLPARLRTYARLACIARDELFTSDATRRALRFHDLRATGTTWLALRGDDPLKIQARAGHRDLATTMRYIRAAEVLGAGASIGAPFPPLPDSVLVDVKTRERTEGAKAWGQLGGRLRQSGGVPSGIRTRVAALKGLSPGPG